MVDLLVKTRSATFKTVFYETTCLTEEVNCTGPFPQVAFPG